MAISNKEANRHSERIILSIFCFCFAILTFFLDISISNGFDLVKPLEIFRKELYDSVKVGEMEINIGLSSVHTIDNNCYKPRNRTRISRTTRNEQHLLIWWYTKVTSVFLLFILLESKPRDFGNLPHGVLAILFIPTSKWCVNVRIHTNTRAHTLFRPPFLCDSIQSESDMLQYGETPKNYGQLSRLRWWW